MGSSHEDEKTSNLLNDHIDEPVTPETSTWFAKFTSFVAHWGVETNGSVILLDGWFSGC